MIRTSFKWENEEYLDSKYGHKCLHGGGSSDADQDGAENGGGNQGGGNPADANNPGVSTGQVGSSGATADQGGFGASTDHGDSAVADANRDAMRGWDSSPGRSVGFGSPTGSHPDEGQPGFGVSQSFDDVDYGYYDGYATEVIGMKEPGATLSTQQMNHSVFDPGISLSTQQMDTRTFSHNWDNPNTQFSPMESTPINAWDNPNTQFSPMEFGPQHQMALSTQQLGQNVTVGYGPQRQAQMDDIDAMMEQQGVTTQGYVDPETTTLEAIAQQQHEQRQKELGTPVEEVETNPNLISRYDQKQFYSALDDEDATEEAKALEIEGFLDHINRKNYTDTGLLSKLGLRSPQLNQRQQIEQVKNFLGKHQKEIDALNKAYSKQINENPGFRNLLPGYKAITGLMGLIGLEPQHVHPSVQALYDKMVELGLMEKEAPEMTEAKKAQVCNATTGYRWDTESRACVPINQDSDGSYNPYLGILG